MARRKMSEEQRAAAAANLAKARAAKKPTTYKNIAANVLALDEDHGLSMVNVKLYIKSTKEKLSALRQAIHRGERGAQAKYESARIYKNHCETYLREGVWSLDFYGENEEKTMYWKTLSPAYDKDGIQK
jgi:hypothetical protein|tara:strand:+ start:613 stop:999 length:387 start_codon:yes stop_codon:yes gene_type:complete